MKELSLEEALVQGSNNYCTTKMQEFFKPMVVRGVTSKSEIVECQKTQRDCRFCGSNIYIRKECSVNSETY